MATTMPADEHRRQPSRRGVVALIGHREDAGHEQRRPDDLIDEAADDREERLRIGREDAGGALRAGTCRDAAVKCGKRLVVGHVDHRGGDKRAGDLRHDVRRDLRHGNPRVTASASVTAGLRCAPETPADA